MKIKAKVGILLTIPFFATLLGAFLVKIHESGWTGYVFLGMILVMFIGVYLITSSDQGE